MLRFVFIFSMIVHIVLGALPNSYKFVLSSTIKVKGNAALDPNAEAWFALEQVLKRVAVQDPSLELNITKIREISDDEILRILTLAAIGNFTSNKANTLKQPYSVGLDQNGRFFVEERNDSKLAVEAMLIILCIVLFKKWYDEEMKNNE